MEDNNNNNIGFIGSEGANQYSNPYHSDLYSQPSIKRQAHQIAEENKRASQIYLNNTPDTVIPINQNQQDISEYTTKLESDPLEEIASSSQNSTKKQSKKHNKEEKIEKSNTMDYNEHKGSKAYLLNNNKNTKININDDDDEKSMKPPRKHAVCCLCCPLWLCLSITIAILVFIGVMVFIFWPKIPDVNIVSIGLSPNQGDVSSVRYQIPSNSNENKGGVEIDLDIHVNVKNDNFYNLYVHNLDTRVFLQTDNLEKTLIGKGNQKDLKFEKHQTTEFVLPVTIGYYVEDIMKDNALLYLLKACSGSESIKIQYEVDIGILFVEHVYTPTYKGSQSFNCPVNGVNDLSSILMGDIYSSISEYFSNFVGV